jgi:hypothetical protein
MHGGTLIPALMDVMSGSFGPFIEDVDNLRIFVTTRRQANEIDDDDGPVREMGHDAGQDIERYLRVEFEKQRQGRTPPLLPDFPSSSDIQALAQLARGSFGYARTAVDYICSVDESDTPERRLAALLQAAYGHPDGTHAHMDGLYSQILLTALRISPHDRSVVDPDQRNILAALVLLQGEVSCATLASLVGISESKCTAFLGRITPLLALKTDDESGTSELDLSAVCLRHVSFADFLCDPNRCCDPSLLECSVDLARDHLRIAAYCLGLMNNHLRYDICDIKSQYILNVEIQDLQARLNEYVFQSLRYACGFWAVHWIEHIRAAGAQFQLPVGLDQFCHEHLLHWIEVLSLTKELDTAQQVMLELRSIMKVCHLPVFHLRPYNQHSTSTGQIGRISISRLCYPMPNFCSPNT